MAEIQLRPYRPEDREAARRVWNEIVEQGDSFPGDRPLALEEAGDFFAAQTATVCAWDGMTLAGVYILHPNNIGRCAHIANASYAVTGSCRGRGIGRRMVLHSLENARQHGYRGLQYNAVVSSNAAAIHLYRQLGFTEVGSIPGGYRRKDGGYEDILIFFKDVTV